MEEGTASTKEDGVGNDYCVQVPLGGFGKQEVK
jgi:hypothetical protein